MAQNIYDDSAFFAGYAELPRSKRGLAGAPEWPTLRAMLPPMRAKRVLDLGCGYGWFARWARSVGAASVLGVDLSERMLERARSESADDAVRYLRCDLEQFDTAEPFDLAYSSLALHYLADIGPLFEVLARALTAGASFVFSVEHPIYTAPRVPGWVDGRWPVEGYLDEGPRTTSWIVDGVTKHHRTVATYVNALLGRGFQVVQLVEWGPSAAQIAEHSDWSGERERPAFLLVHSRR